MESEIICCNDNLTWMWIENCIISSSRGGDSGGALSRVLVGFFWGGGAVSCEWWWWWGEWECGCQVENCAPNCQCWECYYNWVSPRQRVSVCLWIRQIICLVVGDAWCHNPFSLLAKENTALLGWCITETPFTTENNTSIKGSWLE